MSLLLLFHGPVVVGGDQTVTQATHFTNDQAFLAADVRHSLDGSLLTNSNAFFAADARHSLNGSLFANTNSFFATDVRHILDGSIHPNTNVFHAGSLITGIAQDTTHANVSLFHGDDVRLNLDGTLYVNPNAFGGQDQLDHTINGSLFVNENIFGSGGRVDWLRQGAWYPIKYVGGTKKQEAAEAPPLHITEQELAAYLASLRAPMERNAMIAAAVNRIRDEALAEANRIGLTGMLWQAATLLAAEDEDAELLLLSA